MHSNELLNISEGLPSADAIDQMTVTDDQADMEAIPTMAISEETDIGSMKELESAKQAESEMSLIQEETLISETGQSLWKCYINLLSVRMQENTCCTSTIPFDRSIFCMHSTTCSLEPI